MRHNSDFQAFDPASGFSNDSADGDSVYVPDLDRRSKVTISKGRFNFAVAGREDGNDQVQDVLGKPTSLKEESNLMLAKNYKKNHPGTTRAKSMLS
jgi:hypothetical protein